MKRHPNLFRKLIDQVDPDARPGDLVEVRTPQNELLGYGLYNPLAEISVRMLTWGSRLPDESFFRERFTQALALRQELLQLDAVTNAYRVVHAESDGLPGMVVDRYGDLLSAELFSLAMYQRSAALLQMLCELTGAKQWLIQVPAQAHGQEGFQVAPHGSDGLPESVEIQEHGVRYRVSFSAGHKTGFFCDQRDNRRRLATYSAGRDVLDLCCYTGGFSLNAAGPGQAKSVTGVDLDEQAIALAKENSKRNGSRINWVHADAFGYMRDMQRQKRQYDVVVLDPPKLIRSRKEYDDGVRKYLDFNRLAVGLVKPGGLLLTCSCSGLLPVEEFGSIIRRAAHQAGESGRRMQILERSGAGGDHPVLTDCPETEYLKACWLRVLD